LPRHRPHIKPKPKYNDSDPHCGLPAIQWFAAPALRAFLDARLAYAVRAVEETQLLSGSGVAPNLLGLLNRTGVQTHTRGTDSHLDALAKASNLIRNNAFLEPDAVVIHPTDAQVLQLAKDADGHYLLGPAAGPAGGFIPAVWGMRVVVTPAIAAGTALVGAFGQAAQIFDRGGLTVEMSNSHGEFFRENKVAIRAERRLELAVYRPAAFVVLIF
jgi:HK97 family phage major capsid protein